MTQYNGLCIGGPKDGEYSASIGPYLTVATSRMLPISYADGNIPAKLNVETVTYYYEQMTTRYDPDWPHHARHYGFWRLHNTSVGDIMEALCKAYVSKAKARKRRRK